MENLNLIEIKGFEEFASEALQETVNEMSEPSSSEESMSLEPSIKPLKDVTNVQAVDKPLTKT
jgi:hypothetical protein